jgi:DNA-binding transcriptional MerR regulator
MSGTSVRTLHHYDEIGLLVPSGRSDSGYRLYGAGDLSRLRRILFYRELDFGLEQIGAMLDGSDGNGAADELRVQHRLLRERLRRTERLLEALETEMEARSMNIGLTPEEQFEIFGPETPAKHEAEAQQRWGHTDAWRESRRRAAAYSKADWVQIKAAADANLAGFAQAMSQGEPATGDVARRLADEHRAHISQWFYDCSPQMHARLAELYIADPRFTSHYEKVAPGLARYVHDAIVAAAG